LPRRRLDRRLAARSAGLRDRTFAARHDDRQISFDIGRFADTMTAMRPLSFCLIAILACPLAATPAFCVDDTARIEEPDTGTLTQAEELDSLFLKLKRERDAGKAEDISRQIRRLLTDSGSPTINLLMDQASSAMTKGSTDATLDLLDQVTLLKPDFAEGWNRRATVHYTMGDYRKAMADIQKTLELEPRHFGAIAGMAEIMNQIGDEQLALKAWQRYLEIFPASKEARKNMEDISEKLAGQRT
jgi:tetratricopeptide (TPR) repeat protein